MKHVALGSFSILITGCATITTGTTQSILVDTNPPGAICRFNRDKIDVAVVNPTPGMLNIDKSVHPMSVYCTKEGYYPTTGVLNSNYQPITLGNALVGGIVGIVIDAASGAQNIYDASIQIKLEKIGTINIDKAVGDIKYNSQIKKDNS